MQKGDTGGYRTWADLTELERDGGDEKNDQSLGTLLIYGDSKQPSQPGK